MARDGSIVTENLGDRIRARRDQRLAATKAIVQAHIDELISEHIAALHARIDKLAADNNLKRD
jgi:hypothetical protein